jgi:uncharacterized protein involved in tellurium resistance
MIKQSKKGKEERLKMKNKERIKVGNKKRDRIKRIRINKNEHKNFPGSSQ